MLTFVWPGWIHSAFLPLSSYLPISLSGYASAASSPQLRVSPVILTVDLNPGQQQTKVITVENLSDEAIPLNISTDPLLLNEDERSDRTTEPLSSPLPTWIRLAREDVIIPAQVRIPVELTITPPATIPVGGYYAMINLTPLVRASQADTPRVIPRISIVILGSVGVVEDRTPQEQLKVNSFSWDRPWSEDGRVSLNLSVANTSLHHMTVKPVLTLTPWMGKPVTKDFPDKVILPGRARLWSERDTAIRVPDGIYRASLFVSKGKGQGITQSTWLIVLPLTKYLILAAAAGLTVLIAVFRRRVARAFRALIGR